MAVRVPLCGRQSSASSSCPSIPCRDVGPANHAQGRLAVRGTARESPVLIRGAEQSSAWRIKSVLQRGSKSRTPGSCSGPARSVDDVQVVLSNGSVVSGSVRRPRRSREDYVLTVKRPPRPLGADVASRRFRTSRPAGQFEIKGLPPGNYLALAVEHLEEGQDATRSSCRRCDLGYELHAGEKSGRRSRFRLVAGLKPSSTWTAHSTRLAIRAAHRRGAHFSPGGQPCHAQPGCNRIELLHSGHQDESR